MLSLYVNGISYRKENGEEYSIALNPFALVHNCRFQAGPSKDLKSFKICLGTVGSSNPAMYFTIMQHEAERAEQERSRWVMDISHSILLLSASLIPECPLTCNPVPGRLHTQSRLLAGYLLYRLGADLIAVIYCCLSAPGCDAAQMAMYTNEGCQNLIGNVTVDETTICVDCTGINSASFRVGHECFAASSPSERKVWLKVLDNIKVKLRHGAPTPTEEQLNHHRDSIRPHIEEIARCDLRGGGVCKYPLLDAGPRQAEFIPDGTTESVFSTECGEPPSSHSGGDDALGNGKKTSVWLF